MRLFAGICLIAAQFVLVGTAAPPPKTSNPGVIVTFGDRDDDAFYSDGWGSYANGVGGIEGQIWVSGTGDMTLNLGRSRPTRVFHADYTPAADLPQPPNPPSGTSSGTFLNIGRVWQMPVDPTITTMTGASINPSLGPFRWCRADLALTNCGGYATELVAVTRHSVGTWTVVADLATPTTVGNALSVLVKTTPKLQQLGYYRMPFQLTIQCTNSTCS